jgi:hypothetical protein
VVHFLALFSFLLSFHHFGKNLCTNTIEHCTLLPSSSSNLLYLLSGILFTLQGDIMHGAVLTVFMTAFSALEKHLALRWWMLDIYFFFKTKQAKLSTSMWKFMKLTSQYPSLPCSLFSCRGKTQWILPIVNLLPILNE